MDKLEHKNVSQTDERCPTMVYLAVLGLLGSLSAQLNLRTPLFRLGPSSLKLRPIHPLYKLMIYCGRFEFRRTENRDVKHIIEKFRKSQFCKSVNDFSTSQRGCVKLRGRLLELAPPWTALGIAITSMQDIL